MTPNFRKLKKQNNNTQKMLKKQNYNNKPNGKIKQQMLSDIHRFSIYNSWFADRNADVEKTKRRQRQSLSGVKNPNGKVGERISHTNDGCV
eukprot:m.66002 g.66002  ORF g.66002 m.66002 type:complete len:91 (+) comp23633_c0_seq1:328-600(+)